MYRIQHFVTKFVSDLRQIGGFLRVLRFSSVNKTDLHDITEILLKVALNAIILFYILATCTSIYFNLPLFYHVLISCVYTMYHIRFLVYIQCTTYNHCMWYIVYTQEIKTHTYLKKIIQQ